MESPNEYKVSKSDRGNFTICIERNTSQIPFGIYIDLVRICGTSFCDGSAETFECLIPERFPSALKVLSKWTKIE